MNYTKGNLPLIDTNILVYAYDQIDERKHKISNEIVKKAREIVEDILSSEEWIIIDRTEESQKKAMKLNQEKRIHFWDALIIASMIEYGIKEIITENVSDFSKIKSIKPINPY